MKIGFIGTGQITKAVITGIIKSELKITKIYISKRNDKISKFLKAKNKKIKIFKDNQKIIANSDWVFLAITPDIGRKIIKNYKFKKKQIIISFMSTISLPELKKIINSTSTIVRAIPLPPISLKKGPIPIYPPNKKFLVNFRNDGFLL